MISSKKWMKNKEIKPSSYLLTISKVDEADHIKMEDSLMPCFTGGLKSQKNAVNMNLFESA